MNESLILFGGEVKALGNGLVEAPLVRFGDPQNADLVKDFFNADTDFWTQFPAKVAFLYNHGLDETLKATKLGGGTADVDVRTDGPDPGLWLKAQLNIANAYEAAIYKMAEAKKLGTSSGAVSHLVSREPVDGAFHVKSWPLFEASLTPEPCESRNYGKVLPVKSLPAVKSFKSLLAEIVADEDAPDADSVTPAVKSVYLGRNVEGRATVAAISRLNDALMYGVVSAALNGDDYGCCYPSDVPATPFSTMAPADRAEYLRAAFDEFRDLSLGIIDALASGDSPADAAKSIKQFYSDPESDLPRPVQMLLGQETKQFLQTMGAVVKESERRLSWYDTDRSIKQGRAISADNLAAMQEIHDGMKGHVEKLKSIIDKHANAPKQDAPKSASAGKQALDAYLQFQTALAARNGVLTF